MITIYDGNVINKHFLVKFSTFPNCIRLVNSLQTSCFFHFPPIYLVPLNSSSAPTYQLLLCIYHLPKNNVDVSMVGQLFLAVQLLQEASESLYGPLPNHPTTPQLNHCSTCLQLLALSTMPHHHPTFTPPQIPNPVPQPRQKTPPYRHKNQRGASQLAA